MSCTSLLPEPACYNCALENIGKGIVCKHGTRVMVCGVCGNLMRFDSNGHECDVCDQKRAEIFTKAFALLKTEESKATFTNTFGHMRRKSRDAAAERKAPSQRVLEVLVSGFVTSADFHLSFWDERPKRGGKPRWEEIYENTKEPIVVDRLLQVLSSDCTYAEIKSGGREPAGIEWRDNEWFYHMNGEVLREFRVIESWKL